MPTLGAVALVRPRPMIALTKFAANLAGPLAFALSVLLLALVAFVFARRGYRHLHFCRLDKVRVECGPVVEGVLTGSTGMEEGLCTLRALSEGRPLTLLETVLTVDKNPSPERAAILARLCEEMGLVAQWQARLASVASNYMQETGEPVGRKRNWLHRMSPLGFVLRAQAAENLGVIRHQPSWPLLVEALGDRHSSVRSAAARALGRIQEPESFPALVRRLESAATEPLPKISIRSLKIALGSFPLAQAMYLGRLLESPQEQVRFLAADLVAQLVEREATVRSEHDPAGRGLPSQIAEISLTLSALAGTSRPTDDDLDQSRVPAGIAQMFLTRLRLDENPDVRARAADVIGWLKDERALPALSGLSEDPVWFVRLHAVRALAHQAPPAIEAWARRLTDSCWRVREAAAQALGALGRAGFDRLLEHFLNTEDRYSQEQVVEQFERAGLVSSDFLHRLYDLDRQTAALSRASMSSKSNGSAAAIEQREAMRARKHELLLQELAKTGSARAGLWPGRPAISRRPSPGAADADIREKKACTVYFPARSGSLIFYWRHIFLPETAPTRCCFCCRSFPSGCASGITAKKPFASCTNPR
jgi:HEAT repeat protein